MATVKAFTDISQSKTLSKILPLESADMNYWCGTQIRIGGHKTMDKDLDVPCWSLAALLSVLPKSIIYTPNPTLDGYSCKNIMHDLETYGDNPVDACYDMILKLH